METTRFIFVIDAEHHYNILVRIITIFNRRRIPIKEFSSQSKFDGDRLSITIAFDETRQNAVKLSKRVEKEVDIISINLFEPIPS